MKNLILMLLLIGLFSSYASASIERLMTTEEDAASELKESYKEQYRKEQAIEQVRKEAREEVDAEFAGRFNFFQIDETSLYYLFSTIAQTLAGAFGILGAFTMYRLQSIKNTCQGIGDAIMQSKKNQSKHLFPVQNSYINKDWNAFRLSILAYMAIDECGTPKFCVEYDLPYQIVQLHCWDIEKLVKNYNIIKKQIISALKLTVITISYSLIVLPFSTAVAHYQSLTTILTATVIMLSIKCLIDYSSLVLNALGISDKRKKKESATLKT